jgi:hypothetical protein
MKKMLIATVALAVLTAPAFAGGRGYGHDSRGNDNGLGVKVGVNTGKGGLIGSLLGNNSRHGSTGLGVKVGVNTGKGGVLGSLLGGGRGSSHGYGHGW